MTERQAWAAMARGVEDGTIDSGLCAALSPRCNASCPACAKNPLANIGNIVRRRMLARINAPLGSSGAYRWPLDDEGQRARAAYCRRQVRRLTPKRKAGPMREGKEVSHERP